MKFEELKDKSLAPTLLAGGTWKWRKLESNVATLRRPQTDMPGIPVGDYYPEIHRVNELPQVPILPISYEENSFPHSSFLLRQPSANLPSERPLQPLLWAPSSDTVPSLWYFCVLVCLGVFCHSYIVNETNHCFFRLTRHLTIVHGLICYSIFLGKVKHLLCVTEECVKHMWCPNNDNSDKC